jgi:hypothetical protein
MTRSGFLIRAPIERRHWHTQLDVFGSAWPIWHIERQQGPAQLLASASNSRGATYRPMHQGVEPWVVQGVHSSGSEFRLQLQHPLDQINTKGFNSRQNPSQVLRGIYGEALLIPRILRDTWLGTFRWCFLDTEESHELISIRYARGEMTASEHLRHDVADRQDADACAIGVLDPSRTSGALYQSVTTSLE